VKKRSESVEVKQRLNQMLSKLKVHDFRITPQRLAFLRILASSEKHPTVDKIYEEVRSKFPTTSLATIYKTKEVADETGFKILTHRVDFFGICGECLNKKK